MLLINECNVEFKCGRKFYVEFKCGRKFYVHESMTCAVKNVLYVIKCGGCGEEYIGQTGDFLRKRVTVHNQQIRDPKTRMLYVSGHIDICANQLIPKYMIFPFHTVQPAALMTGY